MSEQQTWRVVLDDGSAADVVVWESSDGPPWWARFGAFGHGSSVAFGHGARDAVATLAGALHWPVAEILAPGEPTRAEAAATARREGAEALRAAAVSAALDAVEAAGYDADLSLDAHCAVTAAVHLAIRALPLPGDATPEHATLPAPVCPAPTGAP